MNDSFLRGVRCNDIEVIVDGCFSMSAAFHGITMHAEAIQSKTDVLIPGGASTLIQNMGPDKSG